MNLGVQVHKTMSLPILNSSKKAGDAISDQFPAGLRVLVVDDDPTCLMILEKMLRTCLYEVTKSNRAEKALSLLRENRNGYDIIISDVHMPDMDGFKLLEHVGLEMDLPVIMMSADDSKSVVMKGVTHGACDYLIKPVRIEALKTIWQHVVRRKKHEWKDVEQSTSIEEEERQQKANEDKDDYSSSANEGNWRNSKRRKEEEDESEDKDDNSSSKKPRVVWSVELHQQFMAAVDQLGVDKAVPKKILELMNVPGLTRENVASHLQKYRLYLRRLSGVSQHQAGFVNSFMGHDAAFGSMSSMNGLDLQALAATGHLTAQSLATLQAATLARSLPKSSISMPMLDQRNDIFSFENPSKLRFGDSNNSNNGNKQVNLLHGIPTTMEPKQLANFRGMNMQPNPRGRDSSSMMVQMNNNNNINNNNNHLSRLSLSPMVQQPSFSTNIVSNVRASVYNPVSQPSSMVGFSGNQNNIDKGMLQNEATSKESLRFDPSYDIFSDLAQHKPTDNWELQNIGISFESTPHVNVQSNNNNNSLSVQPSVLVHQGFSSGESVSQNRNGNAVPNMGNQGFSSVQSGLQNRNRNGIGIGIGNTISNMGHQGFSSGQSGSQNRNASGNGIGNGMSKMGQQLNPFMGENSLRVKSESFPEISSQNTLYSDQFGQEDLLSALLKQQDGIGQVPNDFGFDGFPTLDNLPV